MELFLALLAFMLIGLTSPSGVYVYDVSVLSYFNIYTLSVINDAYYFRISVNNQDDMYIQLETDYVPGQNYVSDFKVDICGYDHEPSDQDCISGHQNCRVGLQPTIFSDTPSRSREDYDALSAYYKYTFQTLENVDYLAFCVTCNNAFRTLKTLYVFSNKTSLAIGLILLFIFLPCICCIVVIGLILKFCGCGGRIRIS